MFDKGELIMCGGHGVCRVVDIVGNPIDRLDRKKKYYLLEPVFEKGRIASIRGKRCSPATNSICGRQRSFSTVKWRFLSPFPKKRWRNISQRQWKKERTAKRLCLQRS